MDSMTWVIISNKSLTSLVVIYKGTLSILLN